MLFGVAYQRVANEHFEAGDIITAKPAGAVWQGAEIADDMSFVTLDVDLALAIEISQDLSKYRVDDVNNPTGPVLKVPS